MASFSFPVTGRIFQAIRLTLFLLRELPVHDDEVRNVHLPIVFAALVEKLLVGLFYMYPRSKLTFFPRQTRVQEDSSLASSSPVREAFVLLQEILRHVVPEALQQRPKFSDETMQESSVSVGSLAFASVFYGLPTPTFVMSYRPAIPLATVMEHLFTLSQTYAEYLVQKQSSDVTLRMTCSHVLLVLARLVEFSDKGPDAPLAIPWDPSAWLENTLDCLDTEVCSSWKPYFFFFEKSCFLRMLISLWSTIAYHLSWLFIARRSCRRRSL